MTITQTDLDFNNKICVALNKIVDNFKNETHSMEFRKAYLQGLTDFNNVILAEIYSPEDLIKIMYEMYKQNKKWQ